MRLLSLLTAVAFLFSATLNFGNKISIGTVELSFSNPSASIGEFEVAIALVLLASAIVSRLYVYGATYVFAFVGIAFGLTSPGVQGLARGLHLIMLPFALAGTILLAFEARSSFKSRRDKTRKTMNRQIITVLQFFVAALVTLGGAAYAKFGTFPVGTALGLIHLSIGLASFYAGYSFWKMKPSSGKLLIALNAVTIGYSTFSEALAQIFSYLPPGFNDSLVGTIIALFVSAAIICLVVSQPVSKLEPKIETSSVRN